MIEIARLRNGEIFRGLRDEEFQFVAGYCREEDIPEGVTVWEEGPELIDFLFWRRGCFYKIQERGELYHPGSGKNFGMVLFGSTEPLYLLGGDDRSS